MRRGARSVERTHYGLAQLSHDQGTPGRVRIRGVLSGRDGDSPSGARDERLSSIADRGRAPRSAEECRFVTRRRAGLLAG